ncbi:UvrD-helicase domain-containing protein [Microbacter margulisiae]|uniref:DNA 3'-5' helicase n=1 Tax=Microbacter margulisiae TaxID=1350067 RepID=A0A7W5H240_9PORP|nr:UvrD-helicase domain-containing protein [Microbacter margulisiae]MBB3188283.1 ATP-dependent exoDNAse (exonuclease V) beta subunit [Microbacter margulisiae]
MLQLYRASAGSGKTFRLTQRYIQMLFDDHQPYAHRRILAVTFTNKATDEMKLRIVDALDKLAHDKPSPFREPLKQRYDWDEKKVNQYAETCLKELLHDYAFFAVSTIDRFFQQVLRNFAREIGLNGGYSIEIETNEILEKAIDNLLAQLDSKEDKQLFDWLMRLTTNQIEEGKKWNLKNHLRTLAQELFKESFKKKFPLIREKLLDKNFLENYQASLIKLITVFETKVMQEAQQALAIIQKHGLQLTDFKNQSRTPLNVLLKFTRKEIAFPSNSFLKLYNEPEEWATKNSPEAARIKTAYLDGLNTTVGLIIELFENHFRAYSTAKTILKQLYALGILMDIDEQIRLESDETHRLLITDTTELLSRIVDGSDTPFVFEKIGVHIQHLLLDEFQDTSDLQWLNFKPLLLNSLATGNDDLVVGDVKQSIYRWRNSNWELLDSQLFKDLGNDYIEEIYLNDNWRSGRAIVRFNNLFFKLASDVLQQQIRQLIPVTSAEDPRLAPLNAKIAHAYNNLAQQCPETAIEGNVIIQVIDDEEKSYHEAALANMVTWIEKWQDAGYDAGEIAILVRRNVEATEIVDYLLHYQNSENAKPTYSYSVISDEALMISNAQSVQLLILLLQYVLHADDTLLRAKIAMLFFQLSGKTKPEEIASTYFLSEESAGTAFDAFEKAVWSCVKEGKNGSLFELTESLIKLLPQATVADESVFLQAFQDWVHHFSLSDSMGIDAFLEWWDTGGAQKKVPSPDTSHAMRVMTVHKAKGLGFKAVLVPFTDWKLDPQKAILWCEPTEAPFNALPLVPVSYNTKLVDTIFIKDFLEEKTATFIDSLNVAYVALTRAKEALVVFAPKPEKPGKEAATFAELLYQCITSNSSGDNALLSYWNPDSLMLEIGNLNLFGQTTAEHNQINYSYAETSGDKRILNVKFHSKNFWEQKTAATPSRLNYGVLMHDVLRRIRHIDDGNKVIAELERSGKISQEEKEEIENMLKEFWTIPETSQWFDPALRAQNETAILIPGESSYIPDRVVFDHQNATIIDYKFGMPHPSHHRQVLQYKRLLEEMGFTAQAFLCYVPDRNVIRVS